MLSMYTGRWDLVPRSQELQNLTFAGVPGVGRGGQAPRLGADALRRPPPLREEEGGEGGQSWRRRRSVGAAKRTEWAGESQPHPTKSQGE